MGTCQTVTATPRIRVDTSGQEGALQPREGEPSPARLLAERPIAGVDKANSEHHEDGAHGAYPGQRGDARPKGDVQHHGEPDNSKRESYGDYVPVPPNAPADHPQAELLESRNAPGEGDDDEGGDERRACLEGPERY